MIKRGSEAIEDFAANDGNLCRGLLSTSSLEAFFPFYRIDLYESLVRLGRKERLNELVDFLDLAIGPFNL